MTRSLRSAALVLLLASPALARRALAPDELRKPSGPRAGGVPQETEDSKEREADRIAPEDLLPQVSLLPVQATDGQIAVRGKEIVVLAKKDGQAVFEARRADGSVAESLFSPGHPVSRWWLSPDGGRLVWRSGDTLYTAVPGTATMDTLGLAPEGEVAFQADGSQAAWVTGGKVVLKRFKADRSVTVPAAGGIVPGDCVAFSPDGTFLYGLISADGGARPDGIAACDLSKDGRTLVRVFTAASGELKTLTVSPDGASLLFVQTDPARPASESLRLFFPVSGDVKTLTRAPGIGDPSFAPGLDRIVFSAKAANGRWQAWQVPTSADSTRGLFLAERVGERDGYEMRRPSCAADGTVWLLLSNDAGITWAVGMTTQR